MALLEQTKLGLATVMLAAFLSLSSTGEGLKQEMWWYTENGNALYFHTHEPNLTSFNSIFPKITRCCGFGKWAIFYNTNYQSSSYVLTGTADGSLYCSTLNASRANSIRHLAANDTSINSISLYSGVNYDREEIFITANARTDIPRTIGSLAVTGSSGWMLYEGKHLDGKSVCYKVPYRDVYSYNQVKDPVVNLTTIGSVYKGCNVREIKMYKDSHFM